MSQVEGALARALVSRVYTLLSQEQDGSTNDLEEGQREPVLWSLQTRLVTALRRAQFVALQSFLKDWQQRQANVDDVAQKQSSEGLIARLSPWIDSQLQPNTASFRLSESEKSQEMAASDEDNVITSEYEARSLIEDIVWQEIVETLATTPNTATDPLPTGFHPAFAGSARGIAGWYARYLDCVRDHLKSDGALKLDFLVNLAAALGTSAETAKKGVARLLLDAASLPPSDGAAASTPVVTDYDAAMNSRMQKVWAALPASRGMPRIVLRAFLTELSTMELADDEFPPLIERKLVEYQTLGRRWGTATDSSTPHGRLWGEARLQARAALEAGDLAGAHYVFAEASEALAALPEPQPRIEAEVLSEEAYALRLSWSYQEAATRYKQAAERTAFDPNANAKWTQRAAEVLYLQGKEFGESEPLREAIALWRNRLTAMSREAFPLDWATTQNHIGNALKYLGEKENSQEQLEAAVTAYREALLGSTRERAPLDWATTQHNLGNALCALGEYESNIARLEEAVAAQQAALQEYTHGSTPIPWAMTQISLGNALKLLGEAENSVTRLQAAVDAYRSALLEYTRASAPMYWAMTQNNLGSALLALGKCQHSNERLDEAEAAYREALKERTRERAPMQWALTQNNLGNVLLARGKRASEPDMLNEAEAAYREALAERTRERAPLQWAMTQNNLGNALLAIGKREKSSERLAAAATAYREALKERTPERSALQWAMTQNNLANALSSWFGVTEEPRLLDDALAAVESAIEKMQASPNYLSVATRVRARIMGMREKLAA